MGQLRISPPPPPPFGLFPFLSTQFDPPRNPYSSVSFVSFAHRLRNADNGFYDFSACYGAAREENRETLRQRLMGNDEKMSADVEDLLRRLALTGLLDRAFVTLSNGQTRRARIAKALLSQPSPDLLILDEPLTGLDVQSRGQVMVLLQELDSSLSPRVIMGIRAQDGIPNWISHVAVVDEVSRTVRAGPKAYTAVQQPSKPEPSRSKPAVKPEKERDEVLVQLENVCVSYSGQKVIDNLSWTIKRGDRIHLQGANGSGKTTLLSLLTGDHPQSYVQRGSSSLLLFGEPRHRIPTPLLASRIGSISPELGNAFPRHLSVEDAIWTGYTGQFVPLCSLMNDKVRIGRVYALLDAFDLTLFAQHKVAEISPGQFSLTLLARALVSRPPLLLLDEMWAGMTDTQISMAKKYLRSDAGVSNEQAVVCISHWTDEIPWTEVDGLSVFKMGS